jgi:hypothetical protein
LTNSIVPATAWQRIVKGLKYLRDLVFSTDVIVPYDERKKLPQLKPTKFLWKNYRNGFYYWEVIECVRRLLLTGAVVFIVPGTAAQAAIACIMAVFTMVVTL